jgi:hypothetical protein
MFSPSLDSDSLGMTRRDVAMTRGADAIHDMLEWAPPARTPASTGFFATREKIEPKALTRRVVFTGNFWMSDEPVAAWRQLSDADIIQSPFRPVSALATKAQESGFELRAAGRRGELIEAGKPLPVAKKAASSFDELSLEPLEGSSDAELNSVTKLAGLELRVEVVRFSKPMAGASGVSTGRVLAVSENYAAQDLGGNHVVIHENKNLDRRLTAGEKVTLGYEGGKAVVYDGLAHDVNIVASWMPKEQQAYLRMVMLDALSMMKAPQAEDERLRDAMRYALESTANFFGLGDTKLRRADIKLVVNEQSVTVRPDGAKAEVRSPAARRP